MVTRLIIIIIIIIIIALIYTDSHSMTTVMAKWFRLIILG